MPGLRVELRRRQPAGPRLGHLARLQDRQGRTRRGDDLAVPRARRSRSCCSTSPGGSTARTVKGKNVFEGGFLGLDNIGVFDRSAPLPTGGHLEQADGTAGWRSSARTCSGDRARSTRDDPPTRTWPQVRRALLLDRRRDGPPSASTPTSCGTRRTASSTTACACPTAPAGGSRCARWSGSAARCRPRDRSGTPTMLARCPASASAMAWFLAQPRPARQRRRPAQARRRRGRRLLSLVNEDKLRRILTRHARRGRVPRPARDPLAVAPPRETPYVLHVDGASYRVDYEPAESTTGMFGGNSNWRGPGLVPGQRAAHRALCCSYYRYYGDDFTIECPTGSGRQMTLFEVAARSPPAPDRDVPARRRRPPAGLRRHREVPGRPALARPRPVLRVLPRRQRAGLGASHQTGWTGLVAPPIHPFGPPPPERSRRPAAGQAYRRVTGEEEADVATAREARGVHREAAAEPARPRDLHVGLAARPGDRGGPSGDAGRRARRPRGTTWPAPASTPCG